MQNHAPIMQNQPLRGVSDGDLAKPLTAPHHKIEVVYRTVG